jgi:hypothetical protein
MADAAGSGCRPSMTVSIDAAGATHTHRRYDQNLNSVPSAIPMINARL